MSMDLMQGVNQLNAHSNNILNSAASGEEADNTQINSAQEATPEPEGPAWKQPRPRNDTWVEESKKTREMSENLLRNLQARNEKVRVGGKTTKEDYTLRTGIGQQKLNLQNLEKLIEYYDELISHEETNYAKIFIKSKNMTKEVLMARCQEYVEIRDSALPVLEIIEKGTTDVQHLIDQAQGTKKKIVYTEGDPNSMRAIQEDQTHLTDEEVKNYMGMQNRDLIMA